MADALFRINADSSNQGFDATPSQVLTLRLKTLPVSGVQKVRFQVWDATAFDPVLDPLRNPPRKAKASPNLTLVGATSGTSVSPVSVDGTVSVTMPGSDNHSWIVRCVVNDGQTTLADGRVVFDPRLVHERMIVIRDTDTGGRPVVATETTQYEDDGWAPECARPGPAGAPFTPATGNADGYLSRHVYVNAASTKVSTSYMGVTVEALATWTTAADIPPGNWFRIALCASGGGGASGATGHTSGRSGGPGGGGGAWRVFVVSRRELIALLPLTPVLPLGGAGGVAPSNTTGSGNRTQGGDGGDAQFGPWKVFRGGGGSAPSTGGNAGAGGSGGGLRSAGNAAGTGTGNGTGGGPFGGSGANLTDDGTTSSVYGGGSCANSTGTIAGIGGSSVYGGGAGGTGAGTSSPAARGGHSEYGGAGGGAGGFANGVSSPNAGAAGGDSGTAGGALAPGGAAGTTNLGNGNPGAAGTDSPDMFRCSGGGGGGGASGTAASQTTTGGNGGAGGFPGGGGGGGGTAVATDTFLATAGNGGKGGDAAMCLEAYA